MIIQPINPKIPNLIPIKNQTEKNIDQSPAFNLANGAAKQVARSVLWFDSDKPLRSGWAWGQKYLKDTVTVASASVGPGKLYLMGSEVAFRGQSHGTFKLLFNALYLSTAKSEGPR